MMQVGFAPAVSVNAVRLTIAGLVAVGVFAVGLLSGPSTAMGDGTTNCSRSVVNVACVGQINGNLVNVNVSDIGVLTDNQLNAFTAEIDRVFVSVASIRDINILSAVLNSNVQTVVNNTVTTVTNTTTKVCTPTVIPAPAPTGSTTIIIGCS